MSDPKDWPNYLPTKRTLVSRCLRWIDDAEPSQIADGVTWYNEAHALASDLAPVISQDGGGIERAAEVIAALSPRTIWSRNVAGAYALMVHGEALPGLLTRNVAVARRILNGERLDDITKGPKTKAFAKAIAGDTDAVVIDVHMLHAMGLDDKTLSRVGCYDALSDVVRAAAVRRGLEPSQAQAIIWVVARVDRWSQNRRR